MIKLELIGRDFDKETAKINITICGQSEVIKNEAFALMDFLRTENNKVYKVIMGRLLYSDMSEIVETINDNATFNILKFTNKED